MNLPSRFFEAVNGTLLILYIAIMLVFARDAFKTLTSRGFRPDGWIEARPSIAVGVLILGDALIRGPVWFYRFLENSSVHTLPRSMMAFFAGLGLIVACAGSILVIRAVSPEQCGWRSWATAIVCSLLFGFGLASTH